MRVSSLYTLLFLLTPLIILAGPPPAADSLTAQHPKEIKRYIRTCFYLNTYNTPTKNINKITSKTGRLFNSYGFRQSNFGLYVPLLTNTWYRKDSVTLSSFHLLTTGNFATAKPTFGGMAKNPEFYKISIGLRGIYSSGKKNIWFVDFNPFLAEDNINYVPTWRYATTIVYNRTVSRTFSFRIGYTKTYLFGEGLNLPLLGCRIGPLDNMHLSIQFPRSAEFDFPIGKKFWGGVFVKPVGGRYNYLNPDTSFNAGIDHTIQFGRYEFLNGFLLDYRPNRNISVNVSMGLVTERNIALSENTNAEGHGYEPFFKAKVAPVLFFSFGASVRLGSSKKINNNYELYDVLDLNNTFDPGDNNMGPTNGNIPANPSRVRVNNIQYMDIKDLIDERDLN